MPHNWIQDKSAWVPMVRPMIPHHLFQNYFQGMNLEPVSILLKDLDSVETNLKEHSIYPIVTWPFINFSP